MPFSTIIGKTSIAMVLARLHAETPLPFILDIGPGVGSYPRLLGPYLPGVRWLAVEVWAPYLAPHNLKSLYERVYIADATCFDYSLLPAGGLVVLGDVLEHIARPEAMTLIKRIMQRFDHAVLSVPLGKWPQDGVDGNPFEAHVDSWSGEEMRATFLPFYAGSLDHPINEEQSMGVTFLARTKPLRATIQRLIAEVQPIVKEHRDKLAYCGMRFAPPVKEAETIAKFNEALAAYGGLTLP